MIKGTTQRYPLKYIQDIVERRYGIKIAALLSFQFKFASRRKMTEWRLLFRQRTMSASSTLKFRPIADFQFASGQKNSRMKAFIPLADNVGYDDIRFSPVAD
jgi:hypothetical protein